MTDKPLFGIDSDASKTSEEKMTYLRPAETVDGRLDPAIETPQSKPTAPPPVAGTKAMRQEVGDLPPMPRPAAQVQPAPVQPMPAQPVPKPVQAQPSQPVQAPAQKPPVQPAPTPAQAQVQAQSHQAAPVPPNNQPAAQPPFPVTPQTGSEEDRKEPRMRALKGAVIVIQNGTMKSFVCKIRNESHGGVMLALPEAMMVPVEFYLIRDADPGRQIPCRVAWRENNRLGAEFIAQLSES